MEKPGNRSSHGLPPPIGVLGSTILEDLPSEDLTMRRLGLILFPCLLAGCGMNHAASEADDTLAWQGTWKLVSCVANGESERGDVQWVVDGDHYKIRVDGKSGGILMRSSSAPSRSTSTCST